MRSQVVVKGAVIQQILDCKYCTVEQKCSWPRKINYLFYHAVGSWYFAKISALEPYVYEARSGEDSGKLRAKLPNLFGHISFLSEIITLQHFPIRFPCNGVKNWANWKFVAPPQNQRSPYAYVRDEHHGLLRRVVMPCINSVVLCVGYVEEVRCYTIPLLGSILAR